jgi:hypothetical protein
MDTIKREATVLFSKMDGQKIRFAFFLLTVVLLVVGAGAPDAGGGVVIH